MQPYPDIVTGIRMTCKTHLWNTVQTQGEDLTSLYPWPIKSGDPFTELGHAQPLAITQLTRLGFHYTWSFHQFSLIKMEKEDYIFESLDKINSAVTMLANYPTLFPPFFTITFSFYTFNINQVITHEGNWLSEFTSIFG